MSPQARTEALSHLGARSFLIDLVTRHKAAAFSMFHDGVGWTWIDSSAAGVDAMELVSNGVLDVLRAAQIAPRGVAKIAMGAIDSYRGASARVDDLIKHKADIMKLVEAYTGDGNFKVAVDKNPRTMRLNVRATGKSVSEVLPFGLVLPAAVVGFMTARAGAAPEPEPVMVEPARPAPVTRPPAARPPAPVARPPASKR
jgi:predicted Fe-Mo cluster-binding NifX family protein